MLKLGREDRRSIELLLTPSWVSGLLAVVAGLIVSVGVILAFEAHNNSITLNLLTWQQTNQSVPTLSQPDIASYEHQSNFGDTWPLLLVWSLAGMIVYMIAVSILHSLSRAEEIRESLNYMHIEPKKMLATTAESLIMRIIASVMLVCFAAAFWKLIVPYSITASYAATADLLSLGGLLYAVLSFAIIVIALHILTILLRLALGKARLWYEV